jgi:Uma2 family endonuclease
MATQSLSPECAPRFRYLTIEEFLLLEETSPVKHEWVAGERYAFAGGSLAHSSIIVGIILALGNRARNAGCRLFESNVLLRIGDDALYYPDVTIVCDSIDSDRIVSTRPCLIVEVLSENTESKDRREKLLAYRRIDSLRDYLMVHQDAVFVERHWRDGEGVWRREEIRAGEQVTVQCIDARIPVEEFYAQLPELPPVQPS